jgi:23S rRNA (uracil1939-C5)-methyltransferase
MGDKNIIVTTEKMVYGGQALATLPDGKKCFVWGALDDEKVEIQITRNKKDWCEGVVSAVINESPNRITPNDPLTYMSTSPWQNIDYEYEAKLKDSILKELFERAKLDVKWDDFFQDKRASHYRNKMEYNFWFDKETQKVSLALHQRGTHLKIVLLESDIASEVINEAGKRLIAYINKNQIQARMLKSVIFRSTQDGEVFASLFLKDPSCADKLDNLSKEFQGLEIIFSNPKSPASVTTELLKSFGEDMLSDDLANGAFLYTTRSFFQVNVPVYEQSLIDIKKNIDKTDKDVIDYYSGVGSIGLSVAGDKNLILIDSDEESIGIAKINSANLKKVEVLKARSEDALDFIKNGMTVIVDPPRAGLHSDVVEKLIESKPKKIIYLSCNPSTQARDIKMLVEGGFKIKSAKGYNFFPRTPHIESLIVLVGIQ